MATIPASTASTASINAREGGVVAGMDLAKAAFCASVKFTGKVSDGDKVTAGQVLAMVEGDARGILASERIALNFLGHLSGVATLTRKFVDAISGTGARICCTRKTTPGLRALEKHAVRMGGGMNHRFGLNDALLVKDNHIAMVKDIATAIERALEYSGHMQKIEVEVDTIPQLKKILQYPIDAVLLDNMPIGTLRKAVGLVRKANRNILIEASGGISLATVAEIARAGVDMISVGTITHSAPSIDVGLDYGKRERKNVQK
jgi:nicotinate-nucleotide pyrophosphorylase (carboxylating)